MTDEKIDELDILQLRESVIELAASFSKIQAALDGLLRPEQVSAIQPLFEDLRSQVERLTAQQAQADAALGGLLGNDRPLH